MESLAGQSIGATKGSNGEGKDTDRCPTPNNQMIVISMYSAEEVREERGCPEARFGWRKWTSLMKLCLCSASEGQRRGGKRQGVGGRDGKREPGRGRGLLQDERSGVGECDLPGASGRQVFA